MWAAVIRCTNARRLPPLLRQKMPLRMLIALLAGCLAAAANAAPQAAPEAEFPYHWRIPLGNEAFTVTPWKSVLTVMATAENPEFEGWRAQSQGHEHRVVDAGGKPVKFYPHDLLFRVTLGTRTQLSDSAPFPLLTNLDVNDYLLHVRFQVKIFHGLRQTIVPASSVRLIGVPADISYDERIYQVSFHLNDVSINDRVVLEVLAPNGERLCKFHLDLL